MQQVEFIIGNDLEPYVNCIMVEESAAEDAATSIPLYADGYPGIMFQQSENGFYLQPKGKLLSELFLYGQTLTPITLETQGRYRFVVFQLYPFASRYLLGVDPRVLNDECYDLLQLTYIDMPAYQQRLIQADSLAGQVKIISALMRELIRKNPQPPNDQIQRAISIILAQRGNVRINEVLEQVYLSERTFERRFTAQVGLTPKQFARIIQFQSSLSRLNEAGFDKLVEVGMDSGFADQSHFIRTFKSYTGQTPSYYLQQLNTSR